jgi:hypothetical protein
MTKLGPLILRGALRWRTGAFYQEGALAKNRIPKKIAGFKVPKSIRKSPMLKVLLGSAAGRRILGDALMAGATAAAAVLIQNNQDDVARTGKQAVKGGRKAGSIATRAVKDAAGAMVGVIGDAAQAVLPDALTGAQKPVRRQAPRERRATH